MLDRLGEALRARARFVADASHELRTPLAILQDRAGAGARAARARREELRAALASAAEETDRLTQLSEDLLTIAQTERGELPLRAAQLLDVGERLERVERSASPASAEHEGGRSLASAPDG